MGEILDKFEAQAEGEATEFISIKVAELMEKEIETLREALNHANVSNLGYKVDIEKAVFRGDEWKRRFKLVVEDIGLSRVSIQNPEAKGWIDEKENE